MSWTTSKQMVAGSSPAAPSSRSPQAVSCIGSRRLSWHRRHSKNDSLGWRAAVRRCERAAVRSRDCSGWESSGISPALHDPALANQVGGIVDQQGYAREWHAIEQLAEIPRAALVSVRQTGQVHQQRIGAVKHQMNRAAPAAPALHPCP